VLDLPNVSLLQRAADDFTDFSPESYDVVVLNSVIQYFPNVDYLVNVLRGALHLVRPGGAVFVGDVRSLALLEAYHLSVELYRAPGSLSLQQLKERVRKGVNEEEELVVDPAFFYALKSDIPQISQVQVTPKRGRFQNELTRFRYEVFLHVNA